jgi:hypothetical protein
MIEHENKKLPTLTEIVQKLKPLSSQIQTMAKIYRIYDTGKIVAIVFLFLLNDLLQFQKIAKDARAVLA